MRAYASHGVSNESVRIIDSEHNEIISSEFDRLFDFLLDPEPEHDGNFRVAWDLDQFIAPLLRRLPKELLEPLWKTGRCYLSPYSINYNPGKSFVIKKGRFRAAYYHLCQFFDNDIPDTSLDQVASAALELKSELLSLGIRPRRLTSPVALLDDLLERLRLPNYMDLPDDVGQMSWNCSGRLWVEAHQLGYFDKAYDYDLNASFPWAASLLYDLREGEWIDAMDPPQYAVYGFVEGTVTITSDISPIAEKDAANHCFYPKGSWRTTLTLQEMTFLRQHPDIGSFKPSRGWYWICRPDRRKRPLTQMISFLYAKRHQSVLMNRVLKRASVGIYGKFLQTYRDGTFAPSFNPVYGSVIENLVRLRLAHEIHNSAHGIAPDLLHVATDGILLARPHPELTEIGDHTMPLGMWRMDSSGPALIIGSGCLYYQDKRPNQISYHEAMELIKSNPDNFTWDMKTNRTMTLGDCVQGIAKRIGQDIEVTTGFSIPLEHDRKFAKFPRSGHDLITNRYSSTALSIGQVRHRSRKMWRSASIRVAQ